MLSVKRVAIYVWLLEIHPFKNRPCFIWKDYYTELKQMALLRKLQGVFLSPPPTVSFCHRRKPPHASSFPPKLLLFLQLWSKLQLREKLLIFYFVSSSIFGLNWIWRCNNQQIAFRKENFFQLGKFVSRIWELY